MGEAPARNFGVSCLKKESGWIAFLDCDVVLSSTWITEVRSYLQRHPVDVVATSIEPYALTDHAVHRLRNTMAVWKTNDTFLSLIGPQGQPLPLVSPAACVVNYEVWNVSDGFREDLQRHEDVEFSLRLFLRGFLIGGTTAAKAKDTFIPQKSQRGLIREFLSRSFSTRWYHHRAKRWSQFLSTEQFRGTLGRSTDFAVVALASAHQTIFNIAAVANYLFNKDPLRLEFEMPNDVRPGRVVFRHKGKVFELSRHYRLLWIEDRVFLYSKQRRFAQMSPSLASELNMLLRTGDCNPEFKEFAAIRNPERAELWFEAKPNTPEEAPA
ncbi:unnamed protein product [Sphagnum jensenii]